jgi:hypothetical protein
MLLSPSQIPKIIIITTTMMIGKQGKREAGY